MDYGTKNVPNPPYTKDRANIKINSDIARLVDHGGRYILKPQSELYPELPENEALSMTLASMVGIEVPVHGLIYSKDSLTYFIKRFDRAGHNIKIPVEDFAQLSGQTRDTKYNSSMEKVIKIIETFCSFPLIEAAKLFKLTLFSFLIGNDDMHLKNFSLITRGEKITLSPAYDLLNTGIVLHSKDEMALPLHGKMRNLKISDFVAYFATQQLKLNQAIVNQVIKEFKQAIPQWRNLISISFLSKSMQEKYLTLLDERCKKLEL